MKIEEVERLEKRKTGTHVSQRLDQLFSLPGGSRLSQIRAGIKCTQLSPIYLSWYTGKRAWVDLGGTVAEMEGVFTLTSLCAVFCGPTAQCARAVRSEI